MPRSSYLVLHILILSFYTWFACVSTQQATDHAVLKEIGDHGDRISDLENIVKQLKLDYHAVVSEVNQLKVENTHLKTEIEELRNTTDTCCLSKQSVLGTSSTPTTVNSSSVSGGKTKKTQCQFDTNGNWLVIQHRQDGSVNFNRKWAEYQSGFGDPSGEIWIGNDFLHQLTTSEDCTLRIDFQDWAHNTRYAEYEHFSVGSAFDNYRLSVGSYSGTAGDSFHYPQSNLLSHHQMMFSTPDRDHDHSFMNCADKLKSGWWFNSCYSSNLNGQYLGHAYGQRMLGEINGEPTLEGTGVEWYPFRMRQYSFRQVTMRVKLTPRSVSIMG